MLTAALIGFLFGFVGSMPVAGPISILVFGRGLEDRGRSTIYLALGSALAESVYAYLAFWGFSALLAMHPLIEPISRGLAALILIGLGLHLGLKKKKSGGAEPAAAEAPVKQVGNKRSFLLGITITALNPTLIGTWGAAVTELHSFDVVSFDSVQALPFSLGVCLGISMWFSVLLSTLKRYRTRFRRATLDRAVRVMGWLLLGLGLFFATRFALYFRKA